MCRLEAIGRPGHRDGRPHRAGGDRRWRPPCSGWDGSAREAVPITLPEERRDLDRDRPCRRPGRRPAPRARPRRAIPSISASRSCGARSRRRPRPARRPVGTRSTSRPGIPRAAGSRRSPATCPAATRSASCSSTRARHRRSRSRSIVPVVAAPPVWIDRRPPGGRHRRCRSAAGGDRRHDDRRADRRPERRPAPRRLGRWQAHRDDGRPGRPGRRPRHGRLARRRRLVDSPRSRRRRLRDGDRASRSTPTGQRLAVAWAAEDGSVTLAVHDGRSDWRRVAPAGRSTRRAARWSPGCAEGRGAARTAGARGQAVTASAAAKIETWASSGSITPKTFWRVRRWTHDPQLSK